MVERASLVLLSCLLQLLQLCSGCTTNTTFTDSAADYDWLPEELNEEASEVRRRIASSAQLHYRACRRKYTCIVPLSQYPEEMRESMRDLVIAQSEDIPFREGLEMSVVSNNIWHFTLMTTDPENTITFLWDDQIMFECDKSVRKGAPTYPTLPFHMTFPMVERDASLSYLDEEGKPQPGLVCVFNLETKKTTKTSVSKLFEQLVKVYEDKKMCLQVDSKKENTTTKYCSDISGIMGHGDLKFNPMDCTGCKMQSAAFPNVSLIRHDRTGCIAFTSCHPMLVNDRFYAVAGSRIECIDREWKIREKVASSERHKTTTFTTLETVVATEQYDCSYLSKLESVCIDDRYCEQITTWPMRITCSRPGYSLVHRHGSFYSDFFDHAHVFLVVDCSFNGLWLGKKANTTIREKLHANTFLACENTEVTLKDPAAYKMGRTIDITEPKAEYEVNEDESTGYYVILIVAAVAVAIVVIAIICVIIACVRPWRRQPVASSSSSENYSMNEETAYHFPPPTAASVGTLPGSQRVGLMFTIVAMMA